LKIQLLANGKDGVWTSSTWIRFIIPFQSVTGVNPLAVVTPQKYFQNKPAKDILVVQRCALENVEAAERLLENARCPIVLDTDDNFLEFPESHPEYEKYLPALAAHKVIASNAAAISVSSERLRQTYSAVNTNTHIIRNGIHLPLPTVPSAKSNSGGGISNNVQLATKPWSPIRILYHGTRTHAKDLDFFLPALARLAKKIDLRLDVVGITDEKQLPNFVRVIEVPTESTVYPKFIEFLLSLGVYDFGIAPLLPTDFNEAKSDIKILEYLAFGAHPIVSNVGSYREWEQGVVSKIDHPATQLEEVLLFRIGGLTNKMSISTPLLSGRDPDSKRKEWIEFFSRVG